MSSQLAIIVPDAVEKRGFQTRSGGRTGVGGSAWYSWDLWPLWLSTRLADFNIRHAAL